MVIAAALRYLPTDRPAGRLSRAGRRFDLIGALTATGAASLLAYAIVQTADASVGLGPHHRAAGRGGHLLARFLAHERFTARDPLMPLALWRNRSVAGSNLVSALLSSAIFAMFYSTTLYQQQVLGYSALRTGLAYIPLGLSILVSAGAWPGGGVADRRPVHHGGRVAGRVRRPVLLARLPVSGQLLTNLIVPEVIVGLGAGLVLIPTSVAAMSGVPAERSGIASALLNVSRQLGGALGLAVISTVVTLQAAHATGRRPRPATRSRRADRRLPGRIRGQRRADDRDGHHRAAAPARGRPRHQPQHDRAADRGRVLRPAAERTLRAVKIPGARRDESRAPREVRHFAAEARMAGHGSDGERAHAPHCRAPRIDSRMDDDVFRLNNGNSATGAS